MTITSTGNISDGGADAVADVTATSLAMIAATGVGAADELDTTVTNLAVNSTTGEIDISNTGDVNLTTVSGVVGVSTTNDDITITAASSITVLSAVSTTGTGIITLDAQGGGVGDSISVQSAISTVNGAVILLADDDITFSAAGAIVSTSGNVTLTADDDGTGGGVDSGGILMPFGSSINAGSGDITLTADETISVSILRTTATTTAITVDSTSGSITSAVTNFDIPALDASAGTITLDAETGIVGAGGNFLVFSALNLDVDNATSGFVNLLETRADAGDNIVLTIDSLVQGSTDRLFLVSSDDMVITTLSTDGRAIIRSFPNIDSITGQVFISEDTTSDGDAIDATTSPQLLITIGNVALTGTVNNVAAAASAASVVFNAGGTCTFNLADCTGQTGIGPIPGNAIDLFEPAQFIPQPPSNETSTNSLDNTPAQAAFNDDPLEGEFAVDVFGTEFELVETAGGAEAAYTGLNYVFQDFWEFLEEGEGGGEGDESEADEDASECEEGQELVGGECA